MPATSTPAAVRNARAPRVIGLVSTYPPRLCGLATFAAALERALIAAGDSVVVAAIDDDETPISASTESGVRMMPGDPQSIADTAAAMSRTDVAIVQHEYGIFGGPDGAEVLDLLLRIDVPTIVVLHTVPAVPTDHQRVILETIAVLASSLVVMTNTAADRLLRNYRVDPFKVTTIPHGARATARAPLSLVAATPTHRRLLTWGLLGPGKGVEHAIRALPLLADLDPPVRYTVAGATHPNVLLREGNRYRQFLMDLAANEARGQVVFDGAYRDLDSLGRLIRATDLVVLPYDSQDQVTSGVLVDAIAAGKPVIATAFPHAIELLADGAGIVVPHGDPVALAAAIRTACDEPGVLDAMSARARAIAPSLSWDSVAERYRSLCDELLVPATSAAV
jgi:glycosyltransferase involved in cell wall biosynthesis